MVVTDFEEITPAVLPHASGAEVGPDPNSLRVDRRVSTTPAGRIRTTAYCPVYRCSMKGLEMMVLLTTHQFFPGHGGGTEVLARDTGLELLKRVHEVHVLTTTRLSGGLGACRPRGL